MYQDQVTKFFKAHTDEPLTNAQKIAIRRFAAYLEEQPAALSLSDIRTLKLAVDNMATNGLTQSGIDKVMALHNKLDIIEAEIERA